jgi:glycosyltransferase involved in cell wall biosynthesis
MVRTVVHSLLGKVVSPLTNYWLPYSRLFLVSDSPHWVISWEMREVAALGRQLGIHIEQPRWARYSRRQTVFYGSHFDLLGSRWSPPQHRLGTTYFHGRPGSDVPEFDRTYENLCRYHPHLQRVQVSHTEMHHVVLNSGIDPEKVHLIPIGVNLAFFQLQTPELRRQARAKLGIPQSAVVVGSFQKDGVGWGDGAEPKLIKGPDIFLQVIEWLKPTVPELFVVLSGPARGYVKAGLERLRVPYAHHYIQHYPDINEFYQTLDVYLITSRQEGGPKAVLEAMACGVPVISSRVGQAMDLIQPGQNGWLLDVEDVEGLAHWTGYAFSHPTSLADLRARGRQTAEAHSYQAQLPLWRRFMQGFVECDA